MAKALVRGCTLLALAALSLHCAGDRGDARPKPSAAPAGKPAQARARIADAAVASRPARAERARAAYERLPVAFVENRGQEDRRVRYSAQGDRFAFHMTPRDIAISLVAKAPGAQGVALAMRFVGRNPRSVLEAGERVPGEMNYLRGNDPAGFHTHVPRYGGVVYRDLWPKVDLHIRGAEGALKYEFHVHPGGRPADIRLRYDGASGVRLASDGSLSIETAIGELRDEAPVAWQEEGGARVLVASRYEVKRRGSSHEVRFALGAEYRADRELVIDPSLVYSTLLGGLSNDSGGSMTIDAAGNVYVIGNALSPDYPTTAGAFDRAMTGPVDIFVTKLNSTGSTLIYSTYLGGNATPVPAGGADEWEAGRGIAVDAAGNAYITGRTTSSNFPTTAGAFDRTLAVATFDATDAWVAKLNATGSALVYSSFLGGFSYDDGLGIAVDAGGNAYVIGETFSGDFPVTAGAFDRTINGESDTFVVKVNPTGSALTYATFIGGEFVDLASKVRVDSAGNALVVGSSRSTTYPTTAGAFDTTPNGMFDIYVTKLNAAGSGLLFSTVIGGSNMDSPGGVALDASGNIYISGGTQSTDFPTTPGALMTALSGGSDGFILELDPTASTLAFSTLLGGPGLDSTGGLVLDGGGNIWTVGATFSADYPVTRDALSTVFAGVTDAVITQVDPHGTAILYSTFFGASHADPAGSIAIDGSGNLYIMGHTYSVDFPTTPGAFDRTFSGNLDVFWGDAYFLKISTGVTPPAGLAALAVSPASVVGGGGATGTATLTSAAPSGGAVVALSSSSPAATVPATITVPAGANQATFAVATTAVTASITATLTGSYGGATQTALLTVAPAATGPLAAPTQQSPADDARFAPGTSVAFDFTDVAGAGSYQIQIDDSQSFAAPLVLDQVVPVSQLTTSSLPTQRMWWRVRARDGAGAPGAWSGSRRFELR